MNARLHFAPHFLHLVLLSWLLLFSAGATHAAYIDNHDGTVTDDGTGLMWDKCSWGQSDNASYTDCSGSGNIGNNYAAGVFNWQEALAIAVTANNQNYKGHDDWRLPNLNELESLTDLTVRSPAINGTAFPNTPLDVFWTSSISSTNSPDSWVVHFSDGTSMATGRYSVYAGGNTVAFYYYYRARLVRSGQSLDLLSIQVPLTATADPVAGGTVSCLPNPVNYSNSSTCTATPATGYSFTAWSGDCTGAAACDLSNVTAAKSVTATFTLNSYTITGTASPTAGGTVACTPNPLNHGSNANCTATPATGYTFSAWSGDCTGATCSLSNVTAAKSITATFTLNTYALTATASPVAGGTVTCTPNPVNHGSNASCTATPATGYTFSAWSGDCTGSNCSLSNVTAAKNVTATFTLNSYSITGTASPTAGGTVTCTPNPLNHGSNASCTATPATGYTFSAWSGDCTGSASCSLSNVTSAKSVTATFTFIAYTKIANNGLDLPDSALLGSAPTQWACTRDNATGLVWEVKTTDGGLRDWNESYTNYDDATRAQMWNGSDYANPTQAEIDAASNSIGFVNAVNDDGLCGHRDWKMPSKDELFALVGTAYVPSINPAFFPNTQSSLYWSGSPSATYSNYAWIVYFGYGGAISSSNRQNGGSLRLVRGGQSQGTFGLTLSVTGSGSGTLTGSPGSLSCASTAGVTSGTCSTSVASGGTVTLTALPTDGSSFSGWSGACSGTSTTCTVIMAALKSVTACFASNSYSVTFDSNGGSSVASQTVAYNTVATVPTAPTKTGSTFAGWYSDSGLTTAFAFTTAIVADTTLYAQWTTNNYTVTPSAGINGSLSPATAQTVSHGATTSFIVTPVTGYGIASASGCGGGLSGHTYTTGPVSANCTVTVAFSASSLNGVCDNASNGQRLSTLPTLLCTAGTPSLLYGSGPWHWTCAGANGGSTASCSTDIDNHTVSGSVPAGGGQISPAGRKVAHNGVTTFTLSPDTGKALGTVNSTCGGSLSGVLYTTGSVTADCAVTASFTTTDTTTTISTVSPLVAKIGQSVTVNYSVAGPASGSDTVTVKDGAGSTLCTGSVTAGTCTTTFSSSGSKTLIAHYSGSAQASASAGKNYIVADAPTLATPTLPSGVVGVPYATLLLASGGVLPYRFSASGLPTGFSLSTNGLLSGTSSAAAAPVVSFTVTDALSQTASRSYTLSLVAQLTVATTHLPEGLVNAPYEQTLQAVGGKTPYVWSVTSGMLPGGLALDMATGQLSGTPSNLGSSASFTVQAQDANGQTARQALSLTTLPPTVAKTGGGTTLSANLSPSNGGATCTLDDQQTLVLTPGAGAPADTPPNTTLPYGLFKMTVQGCTPGQTQLSVKIVYPTTLPPGTQYWKYGKTATETSDHWYLLPSAVISGNTVSFTISDGGLGDDDLSADGSITDPGAPATPTLAISGSPASGQVGSGYSSTLSASNGSGTYNWSIASGGLPTGVTLGASTGLLGGTPTQAGSFAFTVQLIDTSSGTSKSQAFSLSIANAPSPPPPPPPPASTYTISTHANPIAGGSLSCSPNPVTEGGSSTCSASPNTGYSFTGWSGDCSGSGACMLNSVYANKSVTATFALGTFAISSEAKPAAGGSVACTPNPVPSGKTASCVATANAGYAFSGWSGDCSGSTSCQWVSVTANKSVTGNFKGIVTISLSAAPISQALLGQTTTLTAKVSSGVGTPTGSLSFLNGGSTLASVNLNGSGVATYAGNLALGTHNLIARYVGNTTYLAAESAALTYLVASQLPTTLRLATVPNLSQIGQTVMVNATVSATGPANSAAGEVTGKIEVSSGEQNCSIILPASRCTLYFSSNGPKKLNARYSGNTFYSSSQGNSIHFVGKRPTILPSLSILLD